MIFFPAENQHYHGAVVPYTEQPGALWPAENNLDECFAREVLLSFPLRLCQFSSNRHKTRAVSMPRQSELHSTYDCKVLFHSHCPVHCLHFQVVTQHLHSVEKVRSQLGGSGKPLKMQQKHLSIWQNIRSSF